MTELKEGRLESEQISMFLGHKTLLTFQETPGDIWDPIRQQLGVKGSRLRTTDASFLAYSLIDAIVFALYGQVPRVGDDYKQLISHGAERASVLFEFGVGGDVYRIARTARRNGPSQQRLERLAPSGVEPIADRAREIRAEIERRLGLDYDGFTRSVVLPQGQFDAFLKGEPKERRKILVALLGLGVYERMQQLANQKAAAARAESEFVRKQLETDFGGATAEALPPPNGGVSRRQLPRA